MSDDIDRIALLGEIAIFLGNLAKALDDSPYPRGGMSENCRYFKKKIEESLEAKQ